MLNRSKQNLLQDTNNIFLKDSEDQWQVLCGSRSLLHPIWPVLLDA